MDSKARGTYWVLKGRSRDFFVCAALDREHVALCAFGSRVAAEEHARSLDEPQMFLTTLEQHGAEAPPWVCEETLLPKVFEVSREGLWKITRAMSVDYVALDPPPMGQMMGYLELKPSWAFRPERSLPEGKHTFID